MNELKQTINQLVEENIGPIPDEPAFGLMLENIYSAVQTYKTAYETYSKGGRYAVVHRETREHLSGHRNYEDAVLEAVNAYKTSGLPVIVVDILVNSNELFSLP